MKTKPLEIGNIETALKMSGVLGGLGVWCAISPLPNDAWQFDLRAEDYDRLVTAARSCGRYRFVSGGGNVFVVLLERGGEYHTTSREDADRWAVTHYMLQ